MRINELWRKVWQPAKRTPIRYARRADSLNCEPLEDRVVPAYYNLDLPITIQDQQANWAGSIDLRDAGYVSTINYIALYLYGLSHTYPDDLDVVFGVMFVNRMQPMSDAGGGFAINNVNLTFVPDGWSTATLPDNGQIVSGTYRGSAYGENEGWNAAMDTLFGMSPNHIWELYMEDDAEGGGTGSLQGWGMEFYMAPYNVYPIASHLLGTGYTMYEKGSVVLTATADDEDGHNLDFYWDLNNDGDFNDLVSDPHSVTLTWDRLKAYNPNIYNDFTIRVRVWDPFSTVDSPTTRITAIDDDQLAPIIEVSRSTCGSPIPTGGSGQELSSEDQQFHWKIHDPTIPGNPTANATGVDTTVTIRKNDEVIFLQTYSADGSDSITDSFDLNSFGVGQYTLHITATDKDNDRPNDSLTTNFSYILNVLNSPPNAEFTVTSGPEGSPTLFDASATFDADDDEIIEYVWNLGDGTLARGKIIQHTYRDNGTYPVTLTAVPAGGSDVGTKTIDVVIPNVDPTLTASAPSSVDEMKPLTLQLAVFDPGTDTAIITVDWGDGHVETFDTDGPKTHSYVRGGQSHTIRVSLEDEDGVYPDLFVHSVTVLDAPPVVVGLLPSYTARPGVDIDFAVTVIDGADDTFTFSWDFGDGVTLDGPEFANVSHAYTADGTYTVTLVVGDSDGFFTTVTSMVSIGIPVSFTSAGQSIVEHGGSVQITAKFDDETPLPYDVTIPLTISGASPADYSFPNPVIVISAGQLSGSTTLSIVDDNLNEDNEELTVTMGLPVGASRGPVSEHRVLIIDNDAPPSMFFLTPGRTVEESVGSIPLTASLDQISGRDVIIPLAFSGTATFGEDYLAPTQIIIPAGQLTGTVNLTVIDDALPEPAESITVQMLPSGQAFGSTAAGQPTSVSFIIAPSDIPSVSLDSAYRLTAEGVGEIFIRVRPSSFSDQVIRVPFTVSGNAPRIATPDVDFIILEDEFVILPGADQAWLTVQIVDDDLVEGTENFIITLGEPTNATLGVSQWVLTDILDNDLARISFDPGDLEVFEDHGEISVRVVMSNPAEYESTTVTILVSGTATEGEDYTISTKEVTFAPLETEKWITITLIDDLDNEPTENIFLTIGTITMSEGGEAVVGDVPTRQITIRDNDPILSLRSLVRTVLEDAGQVVFQATLSAPTNVDVTVPIRYSGSARFGEDYTGPSSLTISAGSAFADFAITILDDDVFEPTESVTVSFGQPSAALLGTETAITITIIDNDLPDPIVSWQSSRIIVIEEDGEAVIGLSLSHSVPFAVTVHFEYIEGEAKLGQDFHGTVTSLTIPAGSRGAELRVPIIDDAIAEPSENFTIRMISLERGVLPAEPSGHSIQVRILDTDLPPAETISWNDYLDYLDRPHLGTRVNLGAGSLQPPHDNGNATMPNTTTPPSWFDGVLQTASRDWGNFVHDPNFSAVDSMLVVAGLATNLAPPPFNYLLKIPVWTTNWLRKEYPQGGWIDEAAVAEDADGRAPFAKYSDFWGRWGAEMGRQFVLTLAGNKLDEWFKDVSKGFTNFLSDVTDWIPLFDGAGNYVGTAVVKGLTLASSELAGTEVQAKEAVIQAGKSLAKRIFGGYGDGAILYFDMDFNGVRSPQEPFGQTTADGLVLILGLGVADANENGILDFTEGQWVSEGGVDTSVGHRFRIPFVAPANYSMITPSSTVVSKLLQIGAFERTGEGIRAADSRYLSALGLHDQPLAFYDFVSLAAAGDNHAAALYGRETQLYNTIVMAASVFEGGASGLSFPFLADIVIEDIAHKIALPNSSLDFTNPIVIRNLLMGISVRTGITLPQATVNATADLIARTNALIEGVPPIGTRSYVEHVAKVHAVAHGELADQLKSLGDGTITVPDFIANTTNIEGMVEAAPPQNVIPVYLSVSAGDAFEGDEGTTEMTFVVMPFGESSLPISVDFTTRDGSAIAGEDYIHTTGTLIWEPGDSTPRIVTVTILSDTIVEADETLFLVLSNASNAVTLHSQGLGLIRNDDILFHQTDSGEVNQVVLSVDEEEFVLQQDGVEVYRGSFLGGARAVISGQAHDQLQVYVAGNDTVVTVVEADGTVFLYLGRHLVKVNGITAIRSDVSTAIAGLPPRLFAERTFNVTTSVPDTLDPNSVSYQWALFGSGSEEPEVTGTAPSFFFTPTSEGDYVVSLILTDGVRIIAVEQELIVLPVNVAPDSAEDFATTSEKAPVTVDVIANDTDLDDTQTLSLVPGSASVMSMIRDADGSAISLVTSVVTQAGNSVTFDPGSDFVFLAKGETATVTIRYTVTDDFSTPLTADGVLTVTITGENAAPTVTVNQATIVVNEGGLAENSGTFADLDLTDVVTLTASMGTVTMHSDGTWTWTMPATDDVPPTAVTITATDSHGGRGIGVFELSVANVAPTVTITGAPEVTVEGSPITLGSRVTDPGEDTLTYQWRVTRGGIAYAEGTGSGFIFTPDDDGVYSVTLTVTDDDGGTGTDTRVIRVANVAPSVAILNAPTTAREGVPVTLRSRVTDPGTRDVHTYRWSVARDGVKFVEGSGSDFTFTPTRPGTYLVTLTVTDGPDSSAAVVTASTQILVTAVHQNTQPLFTVTGPDGETIVMDQHGSVLSTTPGLGGIGGSGAVGDVTGDGIPDTILGSGERVAGMIAVIDGATGAMAWTSPVFESGYTLGVFVASADVTGDGYSDVAVSAFNGGGGRVTLFDGRTGTVIADFFGIEDLNFRGGARVTFGDVNGDGWIDLIVAAGSGGGPRVAVFDGSTLRSGMPVRLVDDFFVFEPTLRHGVFASAGDVNGDGLADLIFGGGPGGGPRVMIWDAASLLQGGPERAVTLANFFADEPTLTAGALVSAKELDGDRFADVVVGVSDGTNSIVRIFFGIDLTPDGKPPVGLELDLPQDRVYVG